MAATDRLSLLLESKTIGLEDVLRMEQAINRVIAQSEKAKAAGAGVQQGAKSQQASVEAFGASIGSFIRDPLGSASGAVEGFVSKLGPMGIALGAAGAAAIAGGTALIGFIKSTGDAAEKILNLSITTGLGAKEVQLYKGALELSGASIEDLEKASIKLNQTLADTGPAGQQARRALAGIGVSLYDTNGKIKEAGPLILDLSRGLSSITDRAERDKLGVELLGKSFRALIPAFSELSANVETLKRDGIGIDEKTLQSADLLADKLSRVSKILSQNVALGKSFVAQFTEPVIDAILGAAGSRPARGGAFGDPEPKFVAPPSIFSVTTPSSRAADALRNALRGGVSIDAQRQQLSDLRTEIDSQRLTVTQLAATPGLTEAAATREVAALKGLEAQYRNLEASIEAAEKAKRDFEKLNALGTFTLTDQFFKFGPLSTTPTLRRPSERNLPPGANPFDFRLSDRGGAAIVISEADISAANPGTGAAAQNRALGAGIIAAGQQKDAARVGSIQSALAFEAERLRLLVGPGGELAAIRAIAQIRLDAIQKELEITGDIRKADQDRLQVARDRQLEELRFAKERDDKNRATGGQVFDALIAGGSGIRGFASGLGLGFGRTAFGNLFSEIARGSTGLLQLPGQTGADGRPNLLGRVLAGTPFGLDPTKVSLDLNTVATQQNTAALLGGRGGGGILGSLPSSLFGGSTATNPLIFSATGGRSPGIIGADGLPLGISGQGLGLGSPNLGLGLGQKIGLGAAIAGGGLLVKGGIQQGGIGGALDVGAGAASTLAALLPLIGVSGPAAPILAGVALAATVAKGFLPDPRKARARSIQEAMEASRFDFGSSTDLFRDVSGGGAIDKGNITVVNMAISTLSPRSFLDHATEITSAVQAGVKADHPIVETLQGRLNPAGAY